MFKFNIGDKVGFLNHTGEIIEKVQFSTCNAYIIQFDQGNGYVGSHKGLFTEDELSLIESAEELKFSESEMKIIYCLISERYHQLKNEPDTRCEDKFKEIEQLYFKIKDR